MSEDPARQAAFPRGLLAVAGAIVLVLLLVATRYGYHRDELYFVAAAKHLAWGYVDQPPFTIAVAWIADAIAPGSLFALRVFPALTIGIVVIIAGLIARHLGGGRAAVLGGAAAVALSGFFVGVGHLFSTTTFDVLFWSILLYLFVRILDGEGSSLWLWFGAVAGVGLLNKHLVLFLLFGLLIGLLLTPQRRVLRTRWPWLGSMIALLIWSPNLIWQIQQGWPTIEMLGSLQERNSGIGKAIEFVGLQLPFLTVVLVPIALLGIRRIFRPAGERFRAIAIGFLALSVLFLVAGGKAYYIVPFYVVFLPMGMVEMEERWAAGTARSGPRNEYVQAAVALLVMSPFFIPVLPASAIGFFNGVNKELGETIGWEELVGQVAAVYHALPPEEQATATIMTGNYGEAGAIDRFGPDLGLPPAHSGHNNYWLWGPPADGAEPAIFIGYGPQSLDHLCASWEQVATIDNAAGIDNDERGLPIALCHELRRPWSERWTDVRHYN